MCNLDIETCRCTRHTAFLAYKQTLLNTSITFTTFFAPCDLVSHFPFLQFPPLRFCAAFSISCIFTPAFSLCCIFLFSCPCGMLIAESLVLVIRCYSNAGWNTKHQLPFLFFLVKLLLLCMSKLYLLMVDNDLMHAVQVHCGKTCWSMHFWRSSCQGAQCS